jgi:hypothetical protein
LNLLELDNERASLLQVLDDVSPLKLYGAMETLDLDGYTALIATLSSRLEARLAITRSSKDWEEYRRVDGIDRSPLSALQPVGANNDKETQGKGNRKGTGNGKKKEVKKGKSSGKGRR